MKPKIFIIAEAGVNHNGNIDLARRMVDAAYDAGADAVKFQAFKAESMISKFAPKADYQQSIEGSHLEMAKRLEISRNQFKELYDYCKQKGIIFMATPFDIESARFLKELGMDIFKIASGEITNHPLLKEISGYKRQIILSTGMSDILEIKEALSILGDKVIVLHCNTEYPTPPEEVNLRAMLTIKDTFGVEAGYSDHSLGIEVPIAAAALGARVIEKHFTLGRNMPGPDQKASLEPAEFQSMVKAIRNIEKALGSGRKEPMPSELKNKAVARKSIVAAKNIQKGDIFQPENIAVKRPGTGINPGNWGRVVGRAAKRDFLEDELIEL